MCRVWSCPEFHLPFCMYIICLFDQCSAFGGPFCVLLCVVSAEPSSRVVPKPLVPPKWWDLHPKFMTGGSLSAMEVVAGLVAGWGALVLLIYKDTQTYPDLQKTKLRLRHGRRGGGGEGLSCCEEKGRTKNRSLLRFCVPAWEFK